MAIYYIYISKQIYRLETHEEKKSEGRYQYKLYSTRPKNNPNPSLLRLEWMQRLTYSMYGRAGRATIFYRCDMNPCDNIYRLMWHAKIPKLFAPQRQNRVFSTQHLAVMCQMTIVWPLKHTVRLSHSCRVCPALNCLTVLYTSTSTWKKDTRHQLLHLLKSWGVWRFQEK